MSKKIVRNDWDDLGVTVVIEDDELCFQFYDLKTGTPEPLHRFLIPISCFWASICDQINYIYAEDGIDKAEEKDTD